MKPLKIAQRIKVAQRLIHAGACLEARIEVAPGVSISVAGVGDHQGVFHLLESQRRTLTVGEAATVYRTRGYRYDLKLEDFDDHYGHLVILERCADEPPSPAQWAAAQGDALSLAARLAGS